MLTRIDRVQMAVPDGAAAARGWVDLLGAQHAGEDRVACLGAHRSRYRLGDGFVELLEPDGDGEVARAVASRGAHLFAAGAATPDPAALRERLDARGATFVDEGGQLFIGPEAAGDHGLRLVVSADEARERVGAVDGFYEVTNLVADAKDASARCADLFGLNPKPFVPIDSSHYGYTGTLTLFHPERLHRFEIITPHVREKTMGRYFGKFGESLYMAFVESTELRAIAERAAAAGQGFTAVPPGSVGSDAGAGAEPVTVFLHPPALGGMMLGISKRRHAWTWSGHPDWAEESA